jgi:ferredoxin
MKYLRAVRISTAIIIFALLFLVFFNPLGMFSYFGVLVEGTQFTPTVLNSIFNHSIRAIIALVVLVIITFLFGRVYCSFLCPLGIFQDIVMFITKKRSFNRTKKLNLLRYSILVVLLFSAISGSLFLVHFLDPYSIFGRSVIHLPGRFYILGQNSLSVFLLQFDQYFINQIPVRLVSILILLLTFVQIGIVFVLSWKKGRFYCNTVCPVGTLLGFFSRFSFFKLRINNKCIHCGKCESICKSGCVSHNDEIIDTELCVNCYDCVSSCPVNAISHSVSTDTKTTEKKSQNKLKILPGVFAGIVLASAFPFRFLFKTSNKNRSVIVPPGAKSIEHYLSSCVSCHLCVSVCPTNILTTPFVSFTKGFMQPVINYKQGFCMFNCRNCSKVCPTNAISPISLSEKKRTAIGHVKYIKRECIVHRYNEDCGACAEHCPTGAVTTENINGLFYPKIDKSKCVGCGACEHVCPVLPKAIIVRPYQVHKKITAFQDLDSTDIRVDEEEFPF